MSIEYNAPTGEKDIEKYEVQLERRALSGVGWMDQFNDPSSGVTLGFVEALKTGLARQIVSPNFSAAAAIEQLHAVIDQVTARIIPLTLERENDRGRGFFRDEYRSVSQLLNGLPGVDGARAVPDAGFIQNLHEQINGGEYEEDLAQLEVMHDKWPAKVFEYCQALELVSESETSNGGDLMLEIVEEMSNQSEELTLAADEAPAAFVLTHFPNRSRQLTRRLLAGLHIAAVLNKQLGENKTEHENAMLESLKQSYILYNLHGEQWQGVDLGEDAKTRVIGYGVEYLKVLADLQQAGDDERGNRFKEQCWQVLAGFSDSIRGHYEDYTLRHLQTVDVGHAFSDVAPGSGLQKALRQGVYHPERGEEIFNFLTEKNGLKAVVLEDDATQREMVRTVIDDHSPLVTEKDLVFASTEGINKKVIDRLDVGWFVLDIQNDEDLTAGVRVGEAVLRRRIELANNGELPSKTFITVCSASNEAVREAARYFRTIIEEEQLDCEYLLSGSGRTSSEARVFIEVRNKGWGVGDVAHIGRYFSRISNNKY